MSSFRRFAIASSVLAGLASSPAAASDLVAWIECNGMEVSTRSLNLAVLAAIAGTDQCLVSDAWYQYDRHRDVAGCERLQHLGPIHVGQALVEQQHVVAACRQLRQARLTRGDDIDRALGCVAREMPSRQIGVRLVVVSVEHAQLWTHTSLSPKGG